MIDKLAGLPTKIRQLEKRLKEMDASKTKPALVKEIIDTINGLKNMLKEKMDKRETRRKAKEQKAQEVSKESKEEPCLQCEEDCMGNCVCGCHDEVAKEATPKVEDGTVSMPKKEFVDEHEKLVKELEPMVEEHKEQGAELKEVKEAAPATSPKCAICGVSFKSQSEYQQHKEDAHGHRDYSPMDPAVKRDVVKNVEKNLGPAIISEQEPKAELTKFGLDDVVKPIRGEESTGKVMRWDGKPSDLVYVAWESGPLADRDGFGGYYPNDLEKFVEEPVEEKVAEGNPPPPDTSIIPKEENCPCYEDMSVYCPKCKSKKTSDLKGNYEALLKDLKEERSTHYESGNYKWVERLDGKIKDLEQSIAEKFGNEKTAVSDSPFRCEKCHHLLSPLEQSHLENLPNGDQKWNCNEKESAQIDHRDPEGHGLGDLYILPNSPEEANKIVGFLKSIDHRFNWSMANVEGHKWYGKRFIEVPFGMGLEPKMREYFANTPFYAKPVEEVMSKKEAGAQNATELTIMDHTPPRANTSADEIGKDTHDEMQDEWAEPSRDIESARGVPGSLFNAETAPAVVEQLKGGIKAPYVNAQVAALGGPENVSIIFTVSADPKESWNNGILENSRYGKFYLHNDGSVEQFSGAFAGWKQPNRAVRSRNVKSVDQLIQTINSHIAQVQATPKAASLNEQAESDKHKLERLRLKIKRLNPIKDQQEYRNLLTEIDKLASLKIASIPVTVFNKHWSATPVSKEGKLGYDISDERGTKVLHLSPLNGKEMNAEHLKWAAEREITKNYKKASLKEDIAFMKKGSKVWVISDDGKKAKIANLEAGIRGYVASSKIQIEALESQAVSHNGHSDKVLGSTATETLLDCIEGGPIWVSSTELLDANRPPATPEALNPIEEEASKEKLQKAKCNRCGKDFTKQKGHPRLWCDECYKNYDSFEKKESSKDCPDCHGNFVGAEGEKCPTCGRFSVTALKTALPPTIPNQRGYLDNPPVEKEAEYSGYTNYSTWGLALHLDNDQDLYNQSREMAKQHVSNESLASELAATYGTLLEEKGEKDKDVNEVNWNEIAQELLDESKENAEYDRSQGAGGVIDKLPTMDVEQAKDDLLNQLAKETDPEKKKSLEQKYKRLSMNSSLNKVARVVHQKDGWHVLSEEGKNLGGPYKTKGEGVKRLRQVEYFKHHKGAKVRPFSKKAEAMIDPYQALTDHITDMRSRMEQVQQRLESNPLPKVAGKDEQDGSELSVEQVFEDVAMGLDLLESKLKDEPESEELHKGLEELENLLWETEQKAGIKPELSDEEKAEPEHKEIVEDIEEKEGKEKPDHKELIKEVVKEVKKVMEEDKDEEPKEILEIAAAANEWPLCSVESCNNKADSVVEGKRYCYTHSWGKGGKHTEAALPTAIAPTLSNPAPAANATPAVTPDDKKTSCALCGGMMFNSFDAYQQHMQYQHASDTMPTSPTQKNLPTIAASKKKVAKIVTCEDCGMEFKGVEGECCKGCTEAEEKSNKKEAADVQLTDETITTNDPNAVLPDPTVPAAPVIQNVQPTDDDNLEIPVTMPTSNPAPGQKWVFDPVNKKYISMPDPAAPGKTI